MESARNRAWRRSQARNRGGDRATTAYSYKPEKNWKLLYTRDAARARTPAGLHLSGPQRPPTAGTGMINLLFVCSRNQLRSPTAEAMWRRRFNALSAGTSPHARRPIGPADIRWADVIFAMEAKHQHRLQATYARLLEHKRLHCLDIPDDYHCMDPLLMDLLDAKVAVYLDQLPAKQ